MTRHNAPQSIAVKGPNASQIEYWNADAGSTWVRNQRLLDAMLADISDEALSRIRIRGGERLLDIGCGCGATALQLAQKGAKVTAVDISQPMLSVAEARAREAEIEIDFLLSDAESLTFENSYDLLFSRFGVMFFADPVTAFSNLRKTLKPGGKMHFVCWQAPRLNPWMSAPMAAAMMEMPPQDPPDPRAPGPFAFADADYLSGILAQSGFSEVKIEPYSTRLLLAPDIEAAFRFFWQLSPLGRLLQDADRAVQARIGTKVREVFADHLESDGIAMDAACWLVSGQKA